MSFQPAPGEAIAIDDITYCVASHPAAPSMPYGQEGRAAVVYQLLNGKEARALKVFKPRFRVPGLASLAGLLAPFVEIGGLQVCERTVLTARRHTELLRQHPDLTYAVLMPWVGGPTWLEVVVQKQALTPEQSLMLARSLAGILADMEERRLAHCDLSGSNILLPGLTAGDESETQAADSVALVDVEQMYGPGLDRPEVVLSGSPGYAHSGSVHGMWSSVADRFSGAILLAEMLGWCDPVIREASWGESFFDPSELQQPGKRYELLLAGLKYNWGAVVPHLFERAWRSETLSDCPTFGEWLVALPLVAPEVNMVLPQATESRVSPPAHGGGEGMFGILMDLGSRLENQGNTAGALEVYREAQASLSTDSDAAKEIGRKISRLESSIAARAAVPPVTVPLPAAHLGVPNSRNNTAPPSASAPRTQLMDQSGLEALFVEGKAAFKAKNWAQARELLQAVKDQASDKKLRRSAEGLLADVRMLPVSVGNKRKISWWLLLGWILSNIVGWGLVFGGTGYAYFLSGSNGVLLLAPLFGAMAGAMQVILLGGRLQRPMGWKVSLGWIATNALGFSGMLLVPELLYFDYLYSIPAGILVGALVGFLQWLFLRKHLRRAFWWIIATAVGYGIGPSLISWPIYGSIPLAVVAGAVAGVITGVPLVLLLRSTPLYEANQQIAKRRPYRQAVLFFGIVTIPVLAFLILAGLRPCGWLDRMLTLSNCLMRFGDSNSYAQVYDLAFSPDARTIAVSTDSGIELFDAYTRQLVSSFSSYEASVEFTDANTLVGVQYNGNVYNWKLGQSYASDGWVGSIESDGYYYLQGKSITQNGLYVAGGLRSDSGSSIIGVWRNNGTPVWEDPDAPTQVQRTAFSPDGSMLAVTESQCDQSNSNCHALLTVRNAADGHVKYQLADTAGYQNYGALIFSPDGKYLASREYDTLELWDVQVGTLAANIQDSGEGQLAFSPDGKTLATMSYGSDVTLRNVPDGSYIESYDAYENHSFGEPSYYNYGSSPDLAFSPNGHTMAISASDGTVRLLSIR